jgi:Ca2+-binding EF-hand superfamily protein
MNAKKTGLIAAVVGLFGALAFTVQAQNLSETLQADAPAFEELDKNDDGAITRDEARGTWLEKTFSQVDANQDGYITKTEYKEASH